MANQLLRKIRAELSEHAAGDRELLFALRRKIAKELGYDERSRPMERRKLKIAKRKAQQGLCAECQKPLPDTYTVLDRFHAVAGYTHANTRLICEFCDRQIQAARNYA